MINYLIPSWDHFIAPVGKSKSPHYDCPFDLPSMTPGESHNEWYQYFCCCCGGSVIADFLFIVTPIVGVCYCSMFCCMLLYVHSSIAIILMGKRKLVALLNLSSWCLMMVELLFLAVPRGCMRLVIVVFPGYTHLLFFIAQIFRSLTNEKNIFADDSRVETTILSMDKNIFLETILWPFLWAILH